MGGQISQLASTRANNTPPGTKVVKNPHRNAIGCIHNSSANTPQLLSTSLLPSVCCQLHPSAQSSPPGLHASPALGRRRSAEHKRLQEAFSAACCDQQKQTRRTERKQAAATDKAKAAMQQTKGQVHRKAPHAQTMWCAPHAKPGTKTALADNHNGHLSSSRYSCARTAHLSRQQMPPHSLHATGMAHQTHNLAEVVPCTHKLQPDITPSVSIDRIQPVP
jgi:hypothetical protein